jgi:hypothetical protein
MLAAMVALSLSEALTLDDIAICIFSGRDAISARVIGMSHSWYQLVPEVNIYTDSIPAVSWVHLLSNRRASLFFHTTNAHPDSLVGSEFENGWQTAQTRHLYAIADLFDRYPDKKFYFVGDDDTFLMPANLVRVLRPYAPDSIQMFGRLYGVFPHFFPFFRPMGPPADFVHGGAGVVISHGLMAMVGPRLRNCSRIFDIGRMPSDIRLAACLRRLPLALWRAQVRLAGFNSNRPEDDIARLAPGDQVTFHQVIGGNMFRAMVAEEADGFYDWQGVAFQPMKIEVGRTGRVWNFVVGYLLCPGVEGQDCLRAMGGIRRVGDGLFRQEFQARFVVYYRCSEHVAEDEVTFFGEAPAPEVGVVVEVRCPKWQKFIVRSNGTKRVTFEDVGY